MAKPITLSECPLCGSQRIKKIRTDYRRQMGRKLVVVTKLERHACPDCGEVFFGPDAIKRLESRYLPKARRQRISA